MKQSLLKRYLAIALFALLLVLMGIVWKTADRSSELVSGDNTSGAHQTTSESSRGDTRSATRANRTPLALALPTHSYTDLQNFYLPPLELEGLSMRQAFYALLDQYYETCQHTGEVPHRLKVQIVGKPAEPLRATLPHAPFLTQLEMLAALTGMNVERDEGVLRFTEMELADKVVTKSMIVPPDITSRLAKLAGSPQKETIQDDPFTSGQVVINKTSPGDDLRQLLGVDDEKSIIINYIPATSTLVIKSSERDVTRIGSLLETVLQNPQTMIKTTTIKVVLPSDHKLDPSDPNLLANLGRGGIAEMQTMPSVISRPGEKATIEITREQPQAGENIGWIGNKYSTSVSQLGFGFQSSVIQSTGAVNSNRSIEDTDIKYSTVSREAYTDRSKLIVIPTGMVNGKQTYSITSYTELTPSGAPVLRGRDKPEPKK